MKTTLEIPDALFQEAKGYASRNAIPFREVVEVSLRRYLDSKPETSNRFRFRRKTFRAKTLIGTADWAAMRAITYEGRGE